MDEQIDIYQIFKALPHRYPFLLVDRILEIEYDKRIVGLKNVTFNEPFFPGHFPGYPIMPGVLVVEAMAQAGGVLIYLSDPPERRSDLILFTGIDKVKFRKQVVPGDQLIFELEVLRRRPRIVKMAGTARVDGKVAVEAELMAAYGDKP